MVQSHKGYLSLIPSCKHPRRQSCSALHGVRTRSQDLEPGKPIRVPRYDSEACRPGWSAWWLLMSLTTFKCKSDVSLYLLICLHVSSALLLLWFELFSAANDAWLQDDERFNKNKCEVISVSGRGGPYGCETSRISLFLYNLFTDDGEIVSLKRQPRFNLAKNDSWY